jgi:hypothetical protein
VARRAAAPRERRLRALEVQEVLDTLRVQLRQEQSPQRLFQTLRQTRRLLSRLKTEQLSAQESNRLRGELAAIAAQGGQLLGEAPRPGLGKRLARGLRRVVRQELWRGSRPGGRS